MTYKIRYGILDSKIIANIQGPEWQYLGSERERYNGILGWDQRSINAREILAQEHIRNFDNKNDNFYKKLEESILKEGFRNPLLIIAGKRDEDFHNSTRHGFDERVPLYMAEDHSKIVVCLSGGCSRLYFAQKHKLEVPVIISDFTDMFNTLEQFFTVEDILTKYKDPPERIKLGIRGVFQHYPKHSHLE